ncbi:MAG: histidine phosphatase family protein [Ruminococcus sp.]|uniref:histidine phosphatase family protein n=1 Tax=Ruminococcus sp. TaxID=41978 RepID=UPI001B0B8C37|nr:histidine phosphatase family protein [Ruminococcus sp.]MBO7472826.1 histidine phosphatase family protein [Ruminococcus sp.]
MKILIIRHGDPDYTIDSLTKKGHREAELLASRIAPMDISAYYVSPLGRAKATAEYTLKQCGRTAETLDWLHEFDRNLIIGKDGKRRIAWDMLPQDWTTIPEYYDNTKWANVSVMSEADMKNGIDYVHNGLDALLAQHGYERNGNCYNAVRPNEDTIALFCHFGVECVILGHLLGISPMVLWHGFIAAPTSVTTVCTEERRKGIAYFRVTAFGDISHLTNHGEPPAFAGRFCEMFSNIDQRHD